MDAAQRCESASGNEAHEDRLGLIVLLMRRDHPSRSGLVKLCIADLSCCGLDAGPANLLRIERTLEDRERHVESRADLADECFVRIGVGSAEVMVDVRRYERNAAELHECREQRRRIDSPGQREQERTFDRVGGEKTADGVDDHDDSVSMAALPQSGQAPHPALRCAQGHPLPRWGERVYEAGRRDETHVHA